MQHRIKRRDALPKKEERFASQKVYLLAQIMKTTKSMNVTEFISVILHLVTVLEVYLWMPGYSYDPSFP